ncbi:hypothetical protein SAMN05660971_00391 [Halomonas cupida]|uniref:Uncharacterized protein n=1 Tax=Halomonas cupida TaxID=44933 RepID=A0A1M7A7D7_9GAMM|nr:hypothetical protein SAMN05660971_00391 [Halomonas cupida]
MTAASLITMMLALWVLTFFMPIQPNARGIKRKPAFMRLASSRCGVVLGIFRGKLQHIDHTHQYARW